jgi:ferritin-like metal-binding protein YciE
MQIHTMHDLLVSELQDLYSAERQLVQALPKVAEKASNPKLQQAVRSHLEETKTHASRIEKACELLHARPSGRKCKAMEGLIAEAGDYLDGDLDKSVRDAGIITDAQRVEHYEMSAYGSAITFANELGEKEVAQLLHQTKTEEQAADTRLNEIAKGEVNRLAMTAGGPNKSASPPPGTQKASTTH